MVRNLIHFKELTFLGPRPNHKLKQHPLSVVRDCLFNMFAPYGVLFSIRNLRTRHALVTGTHLLLSFQCDRLYNSIIIGQMYTLYLQHRMCTTL